MPPNFDLSQVVNVYVRVTGGEVGMASSLALQNRAIESLLQENRHRHSERDGEGLEGLRVTMKLIVQNRQAKVSVVPSAAALIIKALKEPKHNHKKTKNIKHTGNISLDDVIVIEIAKVTKPRSIAKDLSGTIKEILGTCVFVGCTVDGNSPKDL